MGRRRREDISSFSVRFPNELIQEIEKICDQNHITKSSWLIIAAREKLTKERIKSSEELILKLTSHETG